VDDRGETGAVPTAVPREYRRRARLRLPTDRGTPGEGTHCRSTFGYAVVSAANDTRPNDESASTTLVVDNAARSQLERPSRSRWVGRNIYISEVEAFDLEPDPFVVGRVRGRV
jgi:hypothetical protein